MAACARSAADIEVVDLWCHFTAEGTELSDPSKLESDIVTIDYRVRGFTRDINGS
ncbi:hypothetical protein DaDZ19_39500 [Dickeya ananatis]